MQHTIDISIEWGDCDPARIVFYPNYCRWFDHGTRHLFESVGLNLKTLFDAYQVIGTPLVDARAEFLYPCRFGDRVQLHSRIEEWRRKTLVVAHELYNGEHLAVRGQEIRAWAEQHPDDPARLRTVPIPAEIKQRFSTNTEL